MSDSAFPFGSGTATDAERALWHRVAAHRFDNPDAGLDFARRLAREQGWTPAQAHVAIQEYRRFCFLAIAAGHPVTPSDAVDQVWHLHLQYTEDYWTRFCTQALRQPLHHGPTAGGAGEDRRYRDQYTQTLASYARWFGTPSALLWPDPRERFRRPQRYQRVDRERVWLIRRPSLAGLCRALGTAAAALAAILLPAPAAALAANPLDWSAKPFLLFYALAATGSILLALRWRRQARDLGPPRPIDPMAAWEIGYLKGGPVQATDVAILELLQRGAITCDYQEGRLRADIASEASLPGPLQATLAMVRLEGRPHKLLPRMTHVFDNVRDRLVESRLALDRAAAARISRMSILLPATVLALGGVRIMLGIQRDRPIGFLLAMSLALGFATLVLYFKRPRRSLAGDALLRRLSDQHAALARVPGEDRLSLAVAVSGTYLLASTPYVDYLRIRTAGALAAGALGSDGSSGGGGDGSGDGSSGCGGCGGGGGGD